MDEASITTVWDELESDIYELTMHHNEEINNLLEEYEYQQIAIALELDAYERDRWWKDGELEENEDA